jgi:hypothetical protein
MFYRPSCFTANNRGPKSAGNCSASPGVATVAAVRPSGNSKYEKNAARLPSTLALPPLRRSYCRQPRKIDPSRSNKSFS